MEPEARHSGPAPGTIERLAHGIPTHRSAVTADEHTVFTSPALHVLSQHREHMRRDRNRSLARIPS
jgi:hypothetical protein